MLAACARRNVRHEECPRSGAGRRPASSSALRTDVAETLTHTETLELADDPLISPARVLFGKTNNLLAERALQRRPPEPPVRVCPSARDELAVPTEKGLRLDREDCPGRSGKRTAERRQQRAISPCQPRPRGLPAKDRQLVPKNEDLQLLRATRPTKQPHQREQIPHPEIHERPEQATPPSTDGKTPEPSWPNAHPKRRTSLRTLRVSAQSCSRITSSPPASSPVSRKPSDL
jgi:hypothetical protein